MFHMSWDAGLKKQQRHVVLRNNIRLTQNSFQQAIINMFYKQRTVQLFSPMFETLLLPIIHIIIMFLKHVYHGYFIDILFY